MTSTAERTVPDTQETLSNIKIVDVDTHLTEPADLWTSRAPSRYADRVPRIVAAQDMSGPMRESLMALGFLASSPDSAAWVVDDVVLGPVGVGSVVNRNNEKIKGSMFLDWTENDATPAASFVEPRLDMMNNFGIWAQIVYPNVVGFGGQNFAKVPDLDLRNLCASLWNDAMAEMQEESDGRICGMGLLPWWDIAATVREIERIADLGLKGIITNSDPQNQDLPDLSSSHWDPMWEACESLGLPVNFHIGSSATQRSWFGTTPWPAYENNVKLAIGSSMLQLGNARTLANLMFSGVFDRFPAIKVVSVESGIGWIPFMLESLQYQAEEAGVEMARTVTQYFQRNMYACFWFEGGSNFLRDIMRVGEDNCMFETDFPHPTCLFPDPLSHVGSLLQEATPALRRKVLSGNAARVYNLNVE